jgi:glycosyltransferase involved in cell wall biosynthesis
MEGLPVVLMEAMALGVPVIAPDVAGIPELVENGHTGMLFTAGDWDQLAERMVALGEDAALRESLADAGRRRVEEQFDADLAVAPLFERLDNPAPAAAVPRPAEARRRPARPRPAAR